MTPSLRFMRQHARHTRTLTCDPYQIGSNPARQRRHTRTLTHVLLSVRHTRHIVTRGPSHTTPSLGQSMWRRKPERQEGERGTIGGLVTTDTTTHHRTTTRHEPTHHTPLQPQPNATNPTRTTTLDSTKVFRTRNPNQKDIHNQPTVKRI